MGTALNCRTSVRRPQRPWRRFGTPQDGRCCPPALGIVLRWGLGHSGYVADTRQDMIAAELHHATPVAETNDPEHLPMKTLALAVVAPFAALALTALPTIVLAVLRGL